MNLKQLRYFLTVAQEKQITSAAKRLFIAQPPLSYQLKQLEKELGVKLFIRTSHGIELTTAGKDLQTYAEQILTLANQAKIQVNKSAKGEVGTIKLGTISSSFGVFPNQKLHVLTKNYPDIDFEIYEDNTYGILEKLQTGVIDLGIVRTPFNHNGISAKTISDEKMTAVCLDQKLLREKELDINSFKDQPLIIYRRFEEIFNESFAHQGIKPYYAVKCDDARTAILWAEQGMGIALVPESIAKVYSPNNYVLINHQSWQTHLQLIWLKRQLSPLLKRVRDLL